MLALCISLMILATMVVILRFIARHRTQAALALDDWLIVCSLVCFYGSASMGIWVACLYRSGNSILTLSLVETAFKVCYVIRFFQLLHLEFAFLTLKLWRPGGISLPHPSDPNNHICEAQRSILLLPNIRHTNIPQVGHSNRHHLYLMGHNLLYRSCPQMHPNRSSMEDIRNRHLL